MRRAGFDDTTDIPGVLASLPGNKAETPNPKYAGDSLDLDAAMTLALKTEKIGVSFYQEISWTMTDPQVRILAEEFALEERGHVLALERFMGVKPY